MPVVFVSHGSPLALLEAPDALACWAAIGRELPEPKAILAVSAHWEARLPTASLASAPATIHDFGGFPPALYRLRYPAPGAPALAERAVALLAEAGIAAALHPDRGLDHGAWIPLSAMFPDADVPVTQLALRHGAGPADHLAIGRALAPLRDDGVLIVASGAITHNFGWIDRAAGPDATPLPPAATFADWVGERLAAHDAAGLSGYRAAPHGGDAHPTADHFLPLFVAVGAANGEAPQRRRPRFAYRGLAMDAYVWSAPSAFQVTAPLRQD
jgi:4,5-DOPA dioxygenase extradiol